MWTPLSNVITPLTASWPRSYSLNRTRSLRRTTLPSPAKSLSVFFWRHPRSPSCAVRYGWVTVFQSPSSLHHIKLNFNSLTLCDFRVLISAALICPDWICVTSISRWPIWAAATWRTPTCAALTWSGPISPEPTWTWVWKQFSGRHWVIHVHVQCQQTALHTSHSGEVNISFFCLYCLWCFCVIFLPAGEQKTFRFSVFFGHFAPAAPSVVWRTDPSVLKHVCQSHTPTPTFTR